MLIHNFDPVFIDFGVIEIKWYSLAYIFGVFLGWIYVKRIISKLSMQVVQAYMDIKKLYQSKKIQKGIQLIHTDKQN